MNERIRQLWSQAGGHYNSGDLELFGQQHTRPEYTINDPEKFAQLIVQECGVALSPMLRDMISRGQAVELIKKHFGVEL
jgi:hypothetical protein